MQLTVLGRYSPFPVSGGACPGYLVQERETRILLDCGSGTLSRLLQYCSLPDLDALMLTHFHPDHWGDLFNLGLACYFTRTEQGAPPLPVYLPPEGRETFAAIASVTGDLGFLYHRALDVREYKSGDIVQAGDLKLRFFPTEHPLHCHGVIVQGGSRLVYGADSRPCDSLVRHAAGADLFLCEATIEDAERAKTAWHMTGAEAGRVAREAGDVGHLLLTHFSPSSDLQVKLAEAKTAFGSEAVSLAEEMTTITVGGPPGS